MKRLFLTAALVAGCASAFAQGTLTFANAGPGCVFRVFDTDGTTPLSGSGFMADLYWAAGTVTDSTLLAALGAPAPFNSGAQAGYFTGGQRSIPGQPGGSTITVQVRAWNTAGGSFPSWALAEQGGASTGKSVLAQITLGMPPGTPPYMTGLNGKDFAIGLDVTIPEPSSFALAGLGLAAMLLLRRRAYQKHSRLNESRQPTPVERSRLCSASVARRGCVQR